MLNVRNRRVLVVGGGRIGTRKVMSIYKAGAEVTCISLDFSEELLSYKDQVTLVSKEIEDKDIIGWFLVIAATNHIDVNKRVFEVCTNQNILCQTVDRFNNSDFDFMASRECGAFMLAASTYGKAPRYAKEIIDKLASMLTVEDREKLQDEIQSRNEFLNNEKQF
jgi:siroheme synthase, N-terminal domain